MAGSYKGCVAVARMAGSYKGCVAVARMAGSHKGCADSHMGCDYAALSSVGDTAEALSLACAAASLATGTRGPEHDT